MDCLNLGYQGKTLEAFCSALIEHQVEVLIDVRLNPWSQRPQFRKGALEAMLAEHGIRYVHCKQAGNPYKPKRGEVLDFADCAKQYTRHIEANPEILDALEKIVSSQTSALLCYESDKNECHRGILIAALTSRRNDIRVIDL